MVDCFVGLGGNQKNTLFVMQEVLNRFRSEVEFEQVSVSNFYLTTPVGEREQPQFLNAVCRFTTNSSPRSLWNKLKTLEIRMGKKTLYKNGPRLIDLDLLFYGSLVFFEPDLIIPHPRWHERLFVLAPLADVTLTLPISDDTTVQQLLQKFTNPHNEHVQKIRIHDGSI